MRQRELTLKQRLHYLHTTGFPIFNCVQILFLLCPVLFLLWHVPVMNFVKMSGYGIHALPYLCLLGAVLSLHSGRGSGMRSLGAAIAFAPIGVMGMLQAATGKRMPSGVTRKDREARFTWAALPQYFLWLLVLVGVVWAAAVRPPGAVPAGLWAAWSLFALCPFVCAFSADRARTRAVRGAVQFVVVGLVAVLVVPTALNPRTNTNRVARIPISATDGGR